MKFHHAAVDGVAGSELVMHLLQQSPLPGPDKPVAPREPDRIPTDLEMVSFALRSKLKAPAQFANVLGQSVKFVDTVIKRRRDPEQDAGGTPLVAPRTPWNGAVSARRNLANARVPLETIKDIKNAFGTTVNDVVLAIAGSVLRTYLIERGALPSAPLTAVCPMSVRQKEEHGQANNKVSAMFVCLYTNIEDPVERLKEIHKTTQGAKAEHNALGADTLQNWAELAGPSVFASAVRFYSTRNLADRHRPIHNLVISNVPGPRFPLVPRGRQARGHLPAGPGHGGRRAQPDADELPRRHRLQLPGGRRAGARRVGDGAHDDRRAARAAGGRTRASRVAVSAAGGGHPCAAARTVHPGAACTGEGCGHAEARRAQGRGPAE
jgi:diacylglycerol O-acyltransferase